MKMKRAVALFMALTLLIYSMSSGTTMFGEPFVVNAEEVSDVVEPVNLALGASVSTEVGGTKASNPIENAVDGDTATRWASWSSNEKASILIELAENNGFDTIEIKQGTATRTLTVDVEVSDDKSTWVKVSAGSEVTAAETKITLANSTSAKYVRLNIVVTRTKPEPEVGYFGHDISEIVVSNVSGKPGETPVAVVEGPAVVEAVNLLIGKTVTGGIFEADGKAASLKSGTKEQIFDGDPSTSLLTYSTTAKGVFEFDLDEAIAFNRLQVQRSGNKELTVKVEVSEDQTNWTEVGIIEKIVESNTLVNFDEVSSQNIRITVDVKAGQWQGFDLNEIGLFLANDLPGEDTPIFGNYLKSRIGIPGDLSSQKIIYQPDKAMMYDFDTEDPTKGVIAEGTIGVSDKYYMSEGNSLNWEFGENDAITFDAGFKLDLVTYTWGHAYRISAGFFQEAMPTDGSTRSLDIEFIGENDEVLCVGTVYLHRKGWNILGMTFDVPDQTFIKSLRVSHSGGESGQIYMDNIMIYQASLSNHVQQTTNIINKERYVDRADDYPLTPLTAQEQEGFDKIAEKIVPKLDEVSSLTEENMKEYRDFYATWNIEVVGDTVNGKNPLYYHRAIPGDTTKDSNSHYMYQENEQLCTMIGRLGKVYNQVQDPQQKAELGEMFTNLVKLALVYGGVPNPWYNGRGFADGVYYGKAALEEAGIIDEVADMIKEQYAMDAALYTEHNWDAPPTVITMPNMAPFGTPYEDIYTYNVSEDSKVNEFLWHTTADSFNTEGISIFLTVLVGADGPEKARDLRRLKSWIDNVAMIYSPNGNGTLKPDGSVFHHYGNRFDNYGIAGWRGMTEFVYWLSQTPFAVSQEAHERLIHMANVRFDIMNGDGYAGGPDNMNYVPSEGFLNLAKSGTPDGSKLIDPDMASKWLAFDKAKSFSNEIDSKEAFGALGIVPEIKPQSNITLSYAAQNIHQRSNWQVYTRGITDLLYYTQYERNGFLFYNIGGIDLIENGQTPGMIKNYGTRLLLRHASEWNNINDGYNISRAPGVTSFETPESNLGQVYYQKGSSPFVGGVSMANGNGLFTQKFDGAKSTNMTSTVAKQLSFNKSYFYFGNDIVCLASDMVNTGSEMLQTGLFQNKMESDADVVTLSGDRVLSDASFSETLDSTTTPWMISNNDSMGIYLMPGQTYKVRKGSQTFVGKTGNIVGSWIEETEKDGKYAYIMRVRPTIDSMKTLETSMDSDTPAYQIHRQDSLAHIVESKEAKTMAYVVYDTNGLILPTGHVTDISQSASVMVKEIEEGSGLVIAVSDPDLHVDKTESNPHGYSLTQEITLTVSGRWQLKDQLTKVGVDTQNITASVDGNETTIKFDCVDGLSTEGLFENLDQPFVGSNWAQWNQTEAAPIAPKLSEIYMNGLPVGINEVEKNYLKVVPETLKALSEVTVDVDDQYLVTIIKPETLPGEISISLVDKEDKYLTADYKVFVTYDTSNYSVKVSDTPQPANHSGNTIDNNLSSYWASDVDGCWIEYDFGKEYTINGASIAFMSGDKRAWKFEVEVSSDGNTWKKVFDGQTSGTTSGFDNVYFDEKSEGRYVRFTGHGNTSSAWNSVAELVLLKDDIVVKPGTTRPSSDSSSASSTTPEVTIKDKEIVEAGSFDDSDGLYDDVAVDYWAYDAIHELSLLGKIEGFDSKTFAPEDAITRAELTAFIVNVVGQYDESAIENFEDVTEVDKYQQYIASAYINKLVEGYSDKAFGPDAYITREDAVVILLRALEGMQEMTLSKYEACLFLDKENISLYARDYVASSATYSLINGYEVVKGSEFRPKKYMTRAEAATVLYRFYQLYMNK